MPHVIACPNCSKRYKVAESSDGRRVQCQQCETAFTIAIPATSSTLEPLAASDPFDPLAGPDLSQMPASPAPAARYASKADVSNPSGGPTDAKMRLASCGMLAFGVVLTLGSLAVHAATGSVYLMIVGLIPLMFILGVAGLISPNVVRAIGKYGGHLPWHYKAIGWGLTGLSLLIMVLVLLGLFFVGFETDTPRPRRPVRHGNPSSSPWAQPPTAAERAAQGNSPAEAVDSGATKPLKPYPVTIEIPPDSQTVPADARLQPGTRLQACWALKWNPITFLSENEDGTLTVRWDDFGEAFDCRMVREELIIKKVELSKQGNP